MVVVVASGVVVVVAGGGLTVVVVGGSGIVGSVVVAGGVMVAGGVVVVVVVVVRVVVVEVTVGGTWLAKTAYENSMVTFAIGSVALKAARTTRSVADRDATPSRYGLPSKSVGVNNTASGSTPSPCATVQYPAESVSHTTVRASVDDTEAAPPPSARAAVTATRTTTSTLTIAAPTTANRRMFNEVWVTLRSSATPHIVLHHWKTCNTSPSP